jgi:hypothetical protein
MKKILFLLLMCAANSATAQQRFDEARWRSIISENISPDVRMSAGLYQLARLAQNDRAEAIARLWQSQYRYRASDDRVNVEIVFAT